MQRTWAKLKPFLRWFIFGGTLFFIAQTLRDHWQEVASIRVTTSGWICLAIALGITLLAHVWTGWVWSWILRSLGQPVSAMWGVLTYLRTNVAKYLPGNVWHLYGRVLAARQIKIPMAIATLSVLLEPLLMAAAALAIALVGNQQVNPALQTASLIVILLSLHPRFLNGLLTLAGKVKGNLRPNSPTAKSAPDSSAAPQFQVKHYPVLPLLGEVIFLGLRGGGFLFTVLALQPLDWSLVPLLLSVFSVAWLLGMVIPGAPGGLGVFEATAIAAIGNQHPTLTPAVMISAVALYRLVSILAEVGGAGLAYMGTPVRD